jgi:hypothetical protein
MAFPVGKLSASLLPATWLSLIVSCGIVDDSAGFTAGEQFCQQWLGAMEAREVRCSGETPSEIQAQFDDLNPCLDIAASLATAHLSFDPAHASACLNETETLACWQASPSCAKVFTGKVPAGGSCSDVALVSECEHGSHCEALAQCPGTCSAPAGELGDDCGGPADLACDGRLSCDPTLGKCILAGVPGASCSTDQPCREGLLCEGSDGPISLLQIDGAVMSGTCVFKPETGPCYFSYECATHHCAGTSPLTNSPGSCMPPKALGDSCIPGASECTPGTYCNADQRCANLPTLGQSCADSAWQGPPCLTGYCDPSSSTCVAFLNAGDPCNIGHIGIISPDPCGGRRRTCNSGYCAAECLSSQHCGSPGEACCLFQRCASGASCNAGKCSALDGGPAPEDGGAG